MTNQVPPSGRELLSLWVLRVVVIQALNLRNGQDWVELDAIKQISQCVLTYLAHVDIDPTFPSFSKATA